jgi:alpha-tubulin suppressor-like RCC1 family protein
VVCCGGNFYGQLGNGSTTVATSPTDVSSLSSVTSIGAGVAHACAVRSDGTLTCWGKNDQGQLGNGVYDNSTLPTALFGGMKGFVSVRAGEMMTCALRSDGNLSCFGGRFLGNGQGATSSPAPVTVTAY